ncbi:EAL domain-containing protein [Sphaerospermopsis sp. LEGE 00249]|nr:EAL domain-containing protein [Sphaerospermopsis sp. LEGE 00249]
MANNLNLSIITERVATNNELDWLITNNCHIIQGYLFSRLLPIEEWKIFLLDKN